MTALIDIFFGSLFLLFSCAVVTATDRRQLLALALAGLFVVALVNPPRAQAQASLITAIETVLNVINGTIHSALNTINSVRTTIDQFYETAIWPVSLINQARSEVTQMIAQYRSAMQSIFSINLHSATLRNPIALESVVRNHQTNDFTAIAPSFAATFGTLPTTQAASPADRSMMDMDDAFAMDTLKTLKESDSADDLTLTEANNLEDQASQAAPGSAPFLTATAAAASIQSQALTQKMIAAELREEAAWLAHDNSLRKRGASITGDVNTQILNLLEKH